MPPLLEVQGLVTRFYSPQGVVHAVNGISYTLNEGEAMAIVGESGSGKTVGVLSLMRLIPSPPGRTEAGRVLLHGQDLLQLSDAKMRDVRGRTVAMVFQDPMTSLNPVVTIGRQLTEALRRHQGLNDQQARERVRQLLDLVGLPNVADRLADYPHQFSGGQRQRLMIATALSCNPSVLIADEPTTALDVTIQAQIIELIKTLQQKLGMAIIWISHDLSVVAGLVDKVAVMYAGFIIEQGPVRALFKQTSHPYTLGLLQSVPALDAREKRRLVSIEGSPPDMLQPPVGCPFAPRCRFVVDRCRSENPPLMAAGPDHWSACWRWEDVRREVTADGR